MVSTCTRIQIRLQKPLDQILPELHCSERKKKIIILHDESKFAHIHIYIPTYQREVTFGVMRDNYVSQ